MEQEIFRFCSRNKKEDSINEVNPEGKQDAKHREKKHSEDEVHSHPDTGVLVKITDE